MVVASLEPTASETIRAIAVPEIDLRWRRERAARAIVRACEEFGFFKVVNHGVPEDVVETMEAQGKQFFALPADEKRRAGPPNPLGYGVRNIGFTGDVGELEYLLFHTNQAFISQKAKNICKEDPNSFSNAVNKYVNSVQELACQILEILGQGLGLGDKQAFSRLIRDTENDSLLRLNHYPSCYKDAARPARVGFGEHSDPQILTVLRSNNVAGLQIVAASPEGEVWVPVPPDPTAFYVIVGDVLQVMTNGRLISVRHRAMANSYSSRLSIAYFAAPPLHRTIRPLLETVTPRSPRQYKSFTWGEFKKAMYSLRLGHNRLEFYRLDGDEQDVHESSER